MLEPGRTFNTTSAYRYGFNGKEQDSILGGGTGIDYNYGARIYDARVGRFNSVDALTKKYPELTPYQFASNSPIAGVDLDGLEFYYAADGKYLGQGSDDKNTEVRLARLGGQTKSGNNIFVAIDKSGKDASVWTIIHKDHSTFLKFASAINQESEGSSFKESYGIASAMVNFAKSPEAVKQGNSLDKMVSETNSQWAGASQTAYNGFMKAWDAGKGNEKFALGAAINALLGGKDYSDGGVMWDGNDIGRGQGNYNRRNDGFQFPSQSMLNQANSIFGSVYASGRMGKNATFHPFSMNENTYHGTTGVMVTSVLGQAGRLGGTIFYTPIESHNIFTDPILTTNYKSPKYGKKLDDPKR